MRLFQSIYIVHKLQKIKSYTFPHRFWNEGNPHKISFDLVPKFCRYGTYVADAKLYYFSAKCGIPQLINLFDLVCKAILSWPFNKKVQKRDRCKYDTQKIGTRKRWGK